MELTKHTPGPWMISNNEIEGDDKYGYCIIGNHGSKFVGNLLRQNFPKNKGSKDVTGHANAKLIAAAPELLQSLIECLEGAEELNAEFQEGWYDVIARAKEAIKKATE